MRIAIRQLEAYNRLATKGAKQAALALSQMIGVRMTHGMTGVSLITDDALPEIFRGDRHVAVRVGLSSGRSGETVLIFDPDTVGRLRTRLRSRGAQSSFVGGPFAELGNTMLGGFIDGWANTLGTGIEHTPPKRPCDSGRNTVWTVHRRLSAGREYAFAIDTTVGISVGRRRFAPTCFPRCRG
ncbi:MAG: chemotaxis protein CheC [Halobacteriota archaeon]